jgi:uncharacterized protein with PIN domain
MKVIIKTTVITLITVFFVVSSASAQNHPDTTKADQHKGMMKKGKIANKMMNDSTVVKNRKDIMNCGKMTGNNKGMMKHNKKVLKHDKKMTNNIVRKGIIDVKSIDKNKDGKVYQDVMDWNVISDKPGKCPLCGMKLREVTVKQAKENLPQHGFKVTRVE